MLICTICTFAESSHKSGGTNEEKVDLEPDEWENKNGSPRKKQKPIDEGDEWIECD